jgi:hypothetical protein
VRHTGSSFSFVRFPVFALVSCIRQQSDIARAFDCLSQHALMYGAVARYSPRQNLASFRDKIPQEPGVFEINNVYLFNAETADAAPAHAASAATLRGTTTVEIIIAVVTPSSVFIVCRHNYLLKTVNGE